MGAQDEHRSFCRAGGSQVQGALTGGAGLQGYEERLDTRPIFYQRTETIKSHVFCSFLALVFIKELYRRLEKAGHDFEWADIKQDLEALEEMTIGDDGKKLAIRSECKGVCGKVFRAAGVAIPLAIRRVA